jgi:hypothetical protein
MGLGLAVGTLHPDFGDLAFGGTMQEGAYRRGR